MSNIDALRLGAIAALSLSPSQQQPGAAWPTLARERVYDSRIDLIENAQSPEDLETALSGLENKPILTVYTEEHYARPYGQEGGNRYPAREEVVVLVVEAFIGAKGEIEIGVDPVGNPVTIGTLTSPVTDSATEATLGALVAQVRHALDPKNRNPLGEAFRFVAMEYREFHSTPLRDATRGFRLAARTLKFHLKIKENVWPVYPAAGLPSPLANVAALLPSDSYAQTTLTALAAQIVGDPPIPAAPTQIAIYATADGRVPSATDYDVEASAGMPPGSAAAPGS